MGRKLEKERIYVYTYISVCVCVYFTLKYSKNKQTNKQKLIQHYKVTVVCF